MTSPAGPERKVVTVLFADLAGFTSIAERMDPEDVHAFLQPTMAELGEIVAAHGGTVTQWMGDGFLAVFGVPMTHRDDAERAVRAALVCRDAVRARKQRTPSWPGPSELHAGLQTGEVLVVPTATGVDVVGDTVNTASRLLSVAPGGCVLIGEATRRLTEHVATFFTWAPIRLKGKAEAIHAFQVQAIAPVPGDRPAAAPRTPFVGRRAELEWLHAHLRAAAEGSESRVALVLGTPGVGKSRLVERFRETSGEAVHLVGRCAPYGERPPWHALADALRRHLRVAGDGGEDGTARLDEAVGSALPGAGAEERETVRRALAAILGQEAAPAPAGSRPNLDLAVAVRRFLSGLARDRPVVVLLEDAHWADAELLSFLAWVSDEPWPAAALFVCTGWPELGQSPALNLDPGRMLAVSSLSQEDFLEMTAALLPGEIPPGLSAELLARAGGNPLFLEETIHLLKERRRLERTGNRWALTGTLAEAVPETLQLVVAERLDGLPDAERRALRDAAIAGEAFWDRMLRALGWGREVDSLLGPLQERDLVRRVTPSSVDDAAEYAFKHTVIRDVAYASVPRAARAHKHLAIAGWLRTSPFAGGEEPTELLAFHYAQAVTLAPDAPPYVVRLAIEYLRRAGDRANRQFAWRNAATRYEQGLSFADRLTPDGAAAAGEVLAEMRLAHAEALANLSRLTEAREVAASVRDLARRAQRLDWEAKALVVLAWVESDLASASDAERHVVAARAYLEEARELYGRLGDRRGQAVVLYQTAIAIRFEDVPGLREHLKAAAEAFENAGDFWWELRCYQDLAWVLTTVGGEEFREAYRRLRELTARAGDPRSRGAERRAWGFFRFYAGDPEEARAALTEAVSLGREVGDLDIEIETRYPLALLTVADGDLAGAEAHARRILEVGERRGFRRTQAHGHLVLARVAARRGEADEAEGHLSRAGELVGEIGEYEAGEVFLARAEIALELGRPAEAEGYAERFVDAARRHDDRLWAPLGMLLRARALLSRGEVGAARRALEDAARAGEGVGNALVATGAAGLLAELDAREASRPR